MKAKTGLFIFGSIIIAASCGQNSTKTETTNDSTGTTVNNGTDTSSANANLSGNTGSLVVPDPIQASFRSKYPDVKDVQWSRHEAMNSFDWEWTGWPIMDTADYMARFNYNGSDYWAWYNNETNEWVGSISPVTDFKSLPAGINKTISTDYSGYTIDAVDKEFDKNRTAYEIDLSKGDDKMTLLIDENGKIMKKKTLTDGQRTKEKNQ
jgi:hypothetical protein